MTYLPPLPRLFIALAIGLSGGVVALFISWDGAGRTIDNAMMRTALVGAFMAGLLTADAFGLGGRRGECMALLGFCAATGLGAFIAATLLPFDIWLSGARFRAPLNGVVELGLFGTAFVAAATAQSLTVAAVWLACGACVQTAARRLRSGIRDGVNRGSSGCP